MKLFDNITGIKTQHELGTQLAHLAIKEARSKMHAASTLLTRDGAVCWDGAVRFQKHAGIISSLDLETFNNARVRAHNYAAYIGDQPQLIRNAEELNLIHPGTRIGFISAEDNEIKHAMVMLEANTAGGINNGYLGKSPGWEEISLDDVITWKADGSVRLNNMPDEMKFILIAEGGTYRGTGIPASVREWTDDIKKRCRSVMHPTRPRLYWTIRSIPCSLLIRIFMAHQPPLSPNTIPAGGLNMSRFRVSIHTFRYRNLKTALINCYQRLTASPTHYTHSLAV